MTVVEYVKNLGCEVTLPEAQTEFVSPHMTLMLLMEYPETVVVLKEAIQEDELVGSGGGLYWIYCPKPRKAAQPEMN